MMRCVRWHTQKLRHLQPSNQARKTQLQNLDEKQDHSLDFLSEKRPVGISQIVLPLIRESKKDALPARTGHPPGPLRDAPTAVVQWHADIAKYCDCPRGPLQFWSCRFMRRWERTLQTQPKHSLRAEGYSDVANTCPPGEGARSQRNPVVVGRSTAAMAEAARTEAAALCAGV